MKKAVLLFHCAKREGIEMIAYKLFKLKKISGAAVPPADPVSDAAID